MAVEIERRFLCREPLDVGHFTDPDHSVKWRKRDRITQGYLSDDPCVRVRLVNIRTPLAQAWLTIKFGSGAVRAEFEYEIPMKDGWALLDKCKWCLTKTRYVVEFENRTWEVDQFGGPELEGLWIAEVELADLEEHVVLPEWVGDEVSDDVRWTNLGLARDGRPMT